MKKLFACLLAIAMIICIFSGCGSTAASSAGSASVATSVLTEESVAEATDPAEDAAPAEEATEAEASTDEASADASVDGIMKVDADGYDYIDFSTAPAVSLPLTEDPVTFTYFCCGLPLDSPIQDFNENLTYQLLEEATGVHIDFKMQAMPAIAENLSLMIASGDYTDIIGEGTEYYPSGAAGLLNEEVLVDIAPYLEEYAPNYNWLRENISDFKKITVTDEGTMPGFKTLSVNSPGNTEGILLRQDWLDDLRMDKPITYDDYEEFALALLNDGYTNAPIEINYYAESAMSYGYGTWTDLSSDILSNVTIADGKIVYAPISDAMKAYLATMHSWWDEGLLGDELVTTDYTVDVFDEKYAVWDEGGGKAGTDMVSIKDAGSDIEIGVGYMPVLNEGDSIVNGKGRDIYTNAGNFRECVTTACSDPELAISWIDYRYSEEGYTFTNFGELDVTYVEDENGNMSYSDLILNNPEGYSKNTAITVYLWQNAPAQIKSQRTKALQVYADIEREAFETWTAQVVADENDDISQYTLTLAESEAIGRFYGDISTYVQECVPKFIIGEMDIETEWDTYVETVEGMGISEAIDAVEAARVRFNHK